MALLLGAVPEIWMTITTMLLGVAPSAAAGIDASRRLEETNVVLKMLPSKDTRPFGGKSCPSTIKVKAGSPT